MKQTAVVILNWNGHDHLEKFLPGVITHSIADADIYVADNHSTDDSVFYIRANFPEVKLVENQHNEGFAGGYNSALKQIEAKYYILLNSDAAVSPDWIKPIIRRMEENDKIAFCQPKIRSFNEPEMFEYAGAGGGYMDKWGYPFCRGRIFDTIEQDKGQYDDAREVFWATGACMFARADVFNKLGGFDASFFAHMEEIDLCWRAKNRGYQVWYEPASVVYHLGAGTLQKVNPHKTFLNFRNNLSMILRNASDAEMLRILAVRSFLDPIAAVVFLLKLQPLHAWAVIKAHIHISFYFFKIVKKREEDYVGLTDKTGVYPGSVVMDYYRSGKKLFSQLTGL